MAFLAVGRSGESGQRSWSRRRRPPSSGRGRGSWSDGAGPGRSATGDRRWRHRSPLKLWVTAVPGTQPSSTGAHRRQARDSVAHGRRRRYRVRPGRGGRDRRVAERVGYDGIWSAEVSHDPFLPLVLAAEHTERIKLGTGIAVAFARNPMTLAMVANDLQTLSKGRFMLGLGSQIKPHIEKRFSMPWSHPAPRMRELILAIRAIWASWADGSRLAFRGRVLPPHPDDPDVRSGTQPLREPPDLPGRRRREDDRGGRRGGRRAAGPRVHHRAVPAGGHRPGPRAGPGGQRPGPVRRARSPTRGWW